MTPHEHHGVSEQRQLLIKGQNSALLTHCEGGWGGGGVGWVAPVISGFPSKGAINAESFHVMRVKVSEIRDAYQIPSIETFAEFFRSATVCSTAYSG